MHCGDQRHLGLCLGYVMRASDLHNARTTILNPFNFVVSISTIPVSWVPHWKSNFPPWRRHASCWRHHVETFFTLLALCEGNSPVTGEVPSQGPVTRRLMFSLICAWRNGWANHRVAGDLRRHRAHYDFTATFRLCVSSSLYISVWLWWSHYL